MKEAKILAKHARSHTAQSHKLATERVWIVQKEEEK